MKSSEVAKGLGLIAFGLTWLVSSNPVVALFVGYGTYLVAKGLLSGNDEGE